MTRLRVTGLILLAVAGLSLLASCGRDESGITNPLGSDGSTLSKAHASQLDRSNNRDIKSRSGEVREATAATEEDFLDQLKAGTFTVCKVAEGSTMQFTFLTTAVGPGVDTAPVYEPEVTLGDGQCADVYTAPVVAGADEVTITEVLPDGWQVDRVFIWSLDVVDGEEIVTSHEEPAGTTTLTGSISAGKLGCVVIFYNSEIPVECTGEIGDFVWNDSGGTKGIQDEGEMGIAGVRVVLKDGNGDVIGEDVTDENGAYLFTDLCAGDYMVMVDESTVPEGWMQTPTEVGGDPCVDNNPNPAMVTLTMDDSSDLCVDFGYMEPDIPCTGEIGDFVWNDSGGTKGIQDEGEMGIAGVRVVLKDGNGDVIGEDVTDENGAYLFTDLCAGDYMVMVDESTVPEGWMQTPTEVGGDPCVDNNPNPAMVTLTMDDSSDLCVDFGYMEPVDSPGTGTPGYWHKPQRWPVDSIVIGGITYSKEDAASYLVGGESGDKSMTMFAQLVAAKLNVLIGNDDSCVADTISDADDWMADHPYGSGVDGSSEAWDVGEPLKDTLDDYNNGRLCAPHRD